MLMVLTMDFFQTRLARNGGRCVLMKRTEVPRELQLFMDADLLIAEDYRNRN